MIEDGNLEMTQVEEERELRVLEQKNERTLRELSDSIRKSNIRIMGIAEEERKEQRAYSNSRDHSKPKEELDPRIQ